VRADPGNQFSVRIRLARPSFLPAFRLRFVIEQQPQLPASPVLVLRMVAEGLAALAAPALRFLEVLPPGIRLQQERLYVDLAVLLQKYGAGEALDFLTDLSVSTAEGRIIVTARAMLPPNSR
jgi:hypothetical protein